jgi:hypothetical protein
MCASVLAQAKDPAEVAALQAQLDAEKERNQKLQSQRPGGGARPAAGGGDGR